ncbi:MAG: Gfo/Idh/MocA family oxidoreductase [Pararhodobacter sp.]|nr:Gfo/Idh/MocA family oxidoreductase [Pararhodobacter sp.]
MQLGVIGCGKWGRNHAHTLAQLSVLGGVADLIPERRAALASELGCRALTTEAMLADPSITAVVIALPPARQAEVALRALAANKHLLVEKPMALDAAEARLIADRAQSAGRVAMTGHLLLFHSAYRALAALVAEQALGDLRYIRCVRAGQGRFYPGTDVVWDLMPHDLSLVRDLMGALPEGGQMQTMSVVSDLADVASLQTAYPGGPMVECFVSRVAPVRERRMLVQGNRASVLWDENEDWPRRLCLSTNPTKGAPPPEPSYLPLEPVQPLSGQLAHFIDAIRGGAMARGTAHGGHEVLRFIHDLHPDAEAPGTASPLAVAWP